jgi:hypothetical protein
VSGRIPGTVTLASDGRTILFKPSFLFAPSERVDVVIQPGIATRSGTPVAPASFSFTVAPFAETLNPYEVFPSLRPDYGYQKAGARLPKAVNDSVPDNFPPMQIEVVDSTALGEGYIFLAVASEVENVGYYLMMLENDGTPFFYRELENDYAYDFKLQPNGQLSYAHFFEHHSYTGGGNVVHKILDESFTLVDSVQAGNGYVAEAHDFQILPNGHYLVFGYYLTPVDMSQIVPGGRPDALVSGGIVQELDAEKNVIFQWRSWDHYDFEGFPFSSRFATRATVSAFHLNSIVLDNDGHILLGTPSMAMKIDRQTGEVLWNIGGAFNEFSFVGVDSADGVGMVTGHTFHRLENGNILVHDNGNRQGTRSSRVHEFAVDEENRVLELIWTYEPDSPIAGWHRGSAQRLPNGNTVIGWGGSSGKPSPAMTEVNAAGEKLYELSFVPPDIESYRAFRFPFAGGAPAAEIVIIEVAPGNTYDFSDDSTETGVQIKLDALTGTGYNELSVTTYHFAPREPEFLGKAPRVLPSRMVLDHFALQGIEGEVRFDVEAWNVRDPQNTVIYHREFADQGLFVALPTTFNPAKNQVSAPIDQFGEFILAVPDFDAVVFSPLPVSPADSSTVNESLPVKLEWAPVGYATGHDLQVATDEAFSDLLVDETFLAEAVYTLPRVDEGAVYYWRVRSSNEAGTSDWSETQMFTAVEPFIQITSPAGGEEWMTGVDFDIRWMDNLDEDVVIELLRAEEPPVGPARLIPIDTIATTASDGAYQWEVEIGLEPGPGYRIHISSSLNSDLKSESEDFSVVAPVSVEDRAELPEETRLYENYPNPFGGTTTITFVLPGPQAVRLSVFDVQGRELETLVDGKRAAGQHTVRFDARGLSDGVYMVMLTTADRTTTRKLVVAR